METLQISHAKTLLFHVNQLHLLTLSVQNLYLRYKLKPKSYALFQPTTFFTIPD